MVSAESVEKQLKRLKFNIHGWGRSEVRELHRILMEGEEVYECVNGMYEGGFALLVATDSRVLLIDKKPLNYLTVEDLRFDMINELDYSHRLLGAHITISAGSKSLTFKSYNQPRLRKLITHVQHCMAESKKSLSAGQQDQKQHLEQINQQLQAYLIAQHQQQETLREQLAQARSGGVHDSDRGQPLLQGASGSVADCRRRARPTAETGEGHCFCGRRDHQLDSAGFRARSGSIQHQYPAQPDPVPHRGRAVLRLGRRDGPRRVLLRYLHACLGLRIRDIVLVLGTSLVVPANAIRARDK